MNRDDIMTAVTAGLGGIGAFLLLMGALVTASGGRGGDVVTLAGLVMLLASLALMLLLFLPGGQRR